MTPRARIDDRLPDDGLDAEVVLHARRLLRRTIRAGGDAAAPALAMIFGLELHAGTAAAWRAAARAPSPMAAGAQVAASLREDPAGDDPDQQERAEVVALGYDAAHVARCVALLQQRKDQDAAFEQIVASDRATLLELSKARDVATATAADHQGQRRPMPVLIRGETGTGKELLAKAIHGLAAARGAFEVVHVAGMPPDLINDELFGHDPGAFTGAKDSVAGRFELADGGTVLIDEVGDLPDVAQVRLLRVLQDQKVTRLGSRTERAISVRVIAATWHDLDADVAAGRFRLDLLHRLRAGAELVLPALREREGFFESELLTLAQRLGAHGTPSVGAQAQDALARAAWPGNLRQLVGELNQAQAVADGDPIRLEHLSPRLQRLYLAVPLHERAAAYLVDPLDDGVVDERILGARIAQVQASLERLPLPPEPADLANVVTFLRGLNDPAPAHQEFVGAIEQALVLAQDGARWRQIGVHWQAVAEATSSRSVREAALAQVAAASARVADLAKAHEQLLREYPAERHPWLSLLRDIARVPLLHGQSDRVMTSFLAIFQLLQALAPAVIDQIREAYARGGAGAVRRIILDRMSAGQDDDDGAPPALRPLMRHTKPGSLSAADWKVVADQETLAVVTNVLGFDSKTIDRYLKQLRLVPRWRRRDPAPRPGRRRSAK